jgi:hypothetical protein
LVFNNLCFFFRTYYTSSLFFPLPLPLCVLCSRSLKVLTERVDDMEVKINELNNKVADSCKNFEDVMAYVDKNIADGA